MRSQKLTIVAAALLMLLAASLAAAQSLGDFARDMRQQKKDAKKPLKVYTNENLPPPAPWETSTAAPVSSATSSSAPSKPKDSTSPASEAKPEETEKSGDKKQTQEYWQGRFKAAEEQLAAAQQQQQLAEDELNLMQIQQARELNPEVQNELNTKIPAKQAEVAAQRAATEKAQKALDDLEKEFKDSGAPEEWRKAEATSPPSQ